MELRIRGSSPDRWRTIFAVSSLIVAVLLPYGTWDSARVDHSHSRSPGLCIRQAVQSVIDLCVSV